jgi:hypothetical protein
MKIVLPLLAIGAALTLAVIGSPAQAGNGPNRCPDDPLVNLPGPEICDFSFHVHNELPAGSRCDFPVTIDYDVTGTIYFFENPPRAVAHMSSVGTATGNGHTLIRTAKFTETASPDIVFTDHGLLARYKLPEGKTITMWAGYQRESILPPEPEIFHGNPVLDNNPEERAAFCAALT